MKWTPVTSTRAAHPSGMRLLTELRKSTSLSGCHPEGSACPDHPAQSWCNVSPFRINTCRTASKQRTSTPFRINTYEKTGGVSFKPNVFLILTLPSSVHSSKFRIPQVLCLPLLRKHRGCGGILPILELTSRRQLRIINSYSLNSFPPHFTHPRRRRKLNHAVS